MAGLFDTFTVAKRGLFVQQGNINTTSHNIANAQTPGYSRQRANVVTTRPFGGNSKFDSCGYGQIGTGAQITQINRIRNEFIDYQVRNAMTDYGTVNVKEQYLTQVENILDGVSDSGLQDALNKFYNSFQELSKSPEKESNRTAALEQAKTLASKLNSVYTQLESKKTSAQLELKQYVTEINTTLDQINELNKQISRVSAIGMQPNDLMDSRDYLLDQLSSKFGVSIKKQDNNTIDVTSTDMPNIGLLVNSKPNDQYVRFSYVTEVSEINDENGNPSITVTYLAGGDENKVKTLTIETGTKSQLEDLKKNLLEDRILVGDEEGIVSMSSIKTTYPDGESSIIKGITKLSATDIPEISDKTLRAANNEIDNLISKLNDFNSGKISIENIKVDISPLVSDGQYDLDLDYSKNSKYILENLYDFSSVSKIDEFKKKLPSGWTIEEKYTDAINNKIQEITLKGDNGKVINVEYNNGIAEKAVVNGKEYRITSPNEISIDATKSVILNADGTTILTDGTKSTTVEYDSDWKVNKAIIDNKSTPEIAMTIEYINGEISEITAPEYSKGGNAFKDIKIVYNNGKISSYEVDNIPNVGNMKLNYNSDGKVMSSNIAPDLTLNYDLTSGKITSAVRKDGDKTYTFNLNENNKITSYKLQQGSKITEIEYNPDVNKPTSMIIEDGNTKKTIEYKNGTIKSAVVEEAGAITNIEYDDEGNPKTAIQESKEDGKFTTATVNFKSDKTAITGEGDENASNVVYTYVPVFNEVTNGEVFGNQIVQDSVQSYMDQLDLFTASFAYSVNAIQTGSFSEGNSNIEGYKSGTKAESLFVVRNTDGTLTYSDDGITAKNIAINSNIEKDKSKLNCGEKHVDDYSGEKDGSRALAIANLKNLKINIGNLKIQDGDISTREEFFKETQLKFDNKNLQLVTDKQGTTVNEYYQSMISKLAQEAKTASSNVNSVKVQLNAYENSRLSESGVSLDEEMSDLIQFQHSYQANAKMISTIDELLDVVINGLKR